MYKHTLKALDFPRIVDLIKGYTTSPLGASTITSLLLPIADVSEVRSSLRATTEFVNLIKIYGPPPLAGLKDVRQDISAALSRGGVFEPSQLLDIAELLGAVKRIQNYIRKGADICPSLLLRSDDLIDLNAIRTDITRCIGPEGKVLDGASDRLTKIRKDISRHRSLIKKILEKILLRQKDVVQESLITSRNGRYVIPLRTDFSRSVEGIVHDRSQTGLTFFVEPKETVELNNGLANLINLEKVEIHHILRRLTEQILTETRSITIDCVILAELDFVSAKARFSIDFGCCEPIINTRNELHLLSARHPLLIWKSHNNTGDNSIGDEVVPLTFTLGKDYDILLFSGPNTGGKTVALKTAGLLSLMAQAGCHIPAAEGSSVGVFDCVFADIGDEQSIEQSLSTFSSHMKNIVDIINRAGRSSLVLLDELGSGTDPAEGAALSAALLDHLNSRHVKTIATTHHELLKTHAHINDGMENGSFQFDPQTFRPTYRFIPGLPGSSNALEIAARLGFPETLQRKARMELGDSRLKLDKLISQLKDQLQTLEEQKEKLGKQKNSLARLKREYLAVVVTEKEENEKNRKELQRRVADFISCSRDELKAALHEMEAGLEEEQINDAPFQKALSRVYADAGRLDLIPELLLRRNGELHKGDAVYIPHLSLRGTLLEDPSKSESVHISCEGKSVRVPVAELLPDKNAKPTQVDNSANRINYEIHTERENPLKSVNIIGKTVDEAIPIVEKALDAALLWEDSSLTIIHGAGTGKLKDAVEKLINNHPSVCGFSSAPRQEGGGGVTVVEL